MIIPAPQSVAFSIFNVPVYWYGITMALAIFVGILMANFLHNKINPTERKDVIIEYSPLIIFCGILGARIYFCSLNPSYYFTHPLEILDIREGGLSIHGGILFGILSLLFVARKAKLSFLPLLDSMGCATILGQAIGRWGNYFNSEAYGLPIIGQNWGLFIPEGKRIFEYSNYTLFHPTFLYESICDIFGFAILFMVLRYLGKQYKGLVFFLYLVIYAIIRFFIERIRIDSALNLGSLPIAEIASCCLFVVGIVGMMIIIAKKRV